MSEFWIPEYQWLPPWEPLPAESKSGFEAELRNELSAGHPLEGVTVEALARRIDTDDVLFAVAGRETRLAVVHLTWRGSADADPTWPHTEFYSSVEEWVDHRMKADHVEYKGAV